MNKLARIREICFLQQNGRCHYCEQPMWIDDREKFAREYRISSKKVHFLQATAEHLVPRSEGGRTVKLTSLPLVGIATHEGIEPRTYSRHTVTV
ncbi:hypothetical protein ICN83_11850 [Sphingopyxis granuli]|nr:hypothetical protein ICN83_11850 [Sphingopyxis granuli]